jgi:glutathione S-transferase
MNKPYEWVAIVTILSMLLFMYTAVRVGGARVKHGVSAPATTGHDEFERHFRVQMNTLEQLVIFLPSLWLFTLYWNQLVAAGLGLVWIVGRIVYMQAYVADPKSRSMGFGITFLATLILMVGALIGAVRALLVTFGA